MRNGFSSVIVGIIIAVIFTVGGVVFYEVQDRATPSRSVAESPDDQKRFDEQFIDTGPPVSTVSETVIMPSPSSALSPKQPSKTPAIPQNPIQEYPNIEEKKSEIKVTIPQKEKTTSATTNLHNTVEVQTKNLAPLSAQPAQIIKTISTPGYTELIAVSDGVAASLSRDDVIQVVDITNPSSPVKIKTIDTPAFAEAVYQKDGFLYIADNKELRILDSTGKTIGASPQNFWASALTIDNGYAYLVAGSEMLILDVKNPQDIKKIGKIMLTGIAPTHVVVHNNHAYVVETLGGLNIIDIQNRATPKIVKVLPFESHTVGFRVRGNYAYLGRVATITSTTQGYSQTSLFEIIDITNPASANVIASLSIPTDIKGLDLEDSYAYIIGSYPYRLAPIDISSPTNPKLVNAGESIVGSADLQDVVVEDKYAFIADGSLGLRVVDVSNTENPKHIADLDLEGRAFNIYKSGNKLYVTVEQKYFNVADIRNPQAPQPTYSESFTASYKYTSIVLRNKKAYFNGGGARIYDITDIKAPRQIKINPAEVDSIQIQGNYLYSTIGEIGLLVYDISNPSSLVPISKTPFPKGIPRDLSVDGQWAVGISNSPYSINVFDISDPKKPVARGDYQYQKYPNTVTVKNGYAYVARAENGVDIFKINLDGTLTLIKNIATQGYAHHVTIAENKAFVVRDGADVYDITNPAKPVFLYHISNNKGEANRVAVDNGYLYIADGYAGVTIVAIPNTDNGVRYPF